MAQEGFKRKLIVILSADVAGCSRLMAEKETAAVRTIAARRTIMVSLIRQPRGRIAASPGVIRRPNSQVLSGTMRCRCAEKNSFY